MSSKVVLIQVALQTTEENELQGGVIDLVGRINSRFSTLTYQPIVFLHTDDVTFSQYLALLTVAAVRAEIKVEGRVECTHEPHTLNLLFKQDYALEVIGVGKNGGQMGRPPHGYYQNPSVRCESKHNREICLLSGIDRTET